MNLPKLPGYSFVNLRKTDFRKSQLLTVSSGTMGTRPLRPEELEQSAVLIKTGQKDGAAPMRIAPPREPVATFPDYIPAHVAFEHLVLRFYAYFRESVPESNDETFRIRYVKIYCYLEDDTIMIEESHERNSGMSQGVLLRRMRVVNPNIKPLGELYTWKDFNVGQNMDICGIVYRIYSCDKFTEEYFQSSGIALGASEEPPDDLYSIKRKLTERPIRVTHINTDKSNLKRFLDFDGKVLRFYATWDDRNKVFGEKRKFIIHYFLVDGTIEIRQVLPLNSGRDPVSQFLKKSLLKKPGTDEYYQDSDFFIGQTVDAFGRQFVIYDADQFTKDFLDNKYGKRDWTPQDAGVQEAYSGVKADRIDPPYNGWGDEEDSLGYCYSLHPKPPRKDIVKLIEKEGMVLRFSAKLKTDQPQDSARVFVIAYYLSDDTVAVFEPPLRNSGFRSGKFIQRAKLKNINNANQYFTAADFRIGQEVVINSFTFEIYEADEYALKYMESQAGDFPQANVEAIVAAVKAQGSVDNLRKMFEQADPELKGFVPCDVASEALVACGLQKHEALTVVRKWTDQSGLGFDYFSFMTCLA